MSGDVGLSVVVRNRELETVEFNNDRGFGITVYAGSRKGSASTSDSSDGAIVDTVRAALNIARYTEEDPCSGLAEAELMARDLPDLDLYYPWKIDVEHAQAIALESEAVALDFDPRIVNSEGAQVTSQRSYRVYGNSHGFLEGVAATRHSTSCVVIAQDGNGMQRDYWYTVARDPSELESHVEIGKTAAERTLARLGSRPIATGTFPVLFNPQMATGLIGHLIGAISGGSLYRKASYLLDSLGKTVIAPTITLAERPHIAKALGSAGFDGEGVATRAKGFVENGVVSSYVLGSYSARRLGMQTTANAGGVFNLEVACDDRATPEELMQQMGTGLVVNELMGQGINLVTGDYSRGAGGVWVENGKPVHPVSEATIAGNLNDIFSGIVGVGDDVDRRGNVHCGSLLVKAMTVAA